ncbi:MAG: hypothetical protein PVH64_09150 [Bacillota bacterium]
MKHKLAKASMILLLFLYAVALFANFMAPYDLVAYDAQYWK